MRFLLTLQPRETAGPKSSSPMWTPVGELQCTPDVSERGVPLSLWQLAPGAVPYLWTLVRALPTLRDVLPLSARI